MSAGQLCSYDVLHVYVEGGKMSVESVFEFRFSAASREEGFRLAQAIGNDMPSTEGYLDHQVIRDVEDPGHLMVITRWGTRPQADAVLSEYVKHPNVQRVTELLSGPPSGFVGDVVP